MCFQYFSFKITFIINLLELPCHSMANREVAALTQSGGLNFLMKAQDNIMFCFVLPSYFTLVLMDGISSRFDSPVMQTVTCSGSFASSFNYLLWRSESQGGSVFSFRLAFPCFFAPASFFPRQSLERKEGGGWGGG